MELIGNNEDMSHWGSYDAVDHGFDARTRGPLGQAALQRQASTVGGRSPLLPQTMSFPQPPPSPMDLGNLVAPEVRGNLQYVRADLQPLLLNALAPTEFVPTGGAQPGLQPGTIKPSLSTVGPAWYHDAVAQGAAVLVDPASVQAGQPLFFIGTDPALIAANAYAGGPRVIVAIDPALDAQAQQSVGMVQGPPGPGGVTVPPPPTQQASAVPWGVIAVGGVVLLGAVVLLSRKGK